MKELPKIPPVEITAPVVDVVVETPTTRTLVFDTEGHDLRFYPGQYVMLEVPHPETGEKLKRAYSIASPPTRRDRLELTVKRMEGGRASVYLTTRVRVGDTFTIRGPYGRFYWTEEISREMVLMGAGSGIVPLMSMLRYIRDRKLEDVSALLLGSFTSYEEIIYRKELEELSRWGNISIAITLTRSAPPDWKGYRGRINEELLRREISDFGRYHYYLCGPPAFVESMRKILKGAGVEKKRIRTEKYL